jgi:hypothetical protein
MENNCNNCGNTNLDFVLFTMQNGQKRVRKQCLNCGSSDSKVYKHSLFKNINDLPLFDSELRENFIKKCFEKRDLKNKIGVKDYYNDVYLKSDEWKSKRQNTLKRDNFKCVCCNSEATQVHHVNYNNVYQEKEKQLISVCNDCHNKIHFGPKIYFNSLVANFGDLKLCQNCNEYHNDENPLICNNCK